MTSLVLVVVKVGVSVVIVEAFDEPARPWDHAAIADWNERHKHDSTDAWDLPDFLGAGQPPTIGG